MSAANQKICLREGGIKHGLYHVSILLKISGLTGKPVLRLRTGFLLHFRAALPPDASEYPEGQGKRRQFRAGCTKRRPPQRIPKRR